MAPETLLSFVVLAVTIGLFVTDKLRLDVVAMLALMAVAVLQLVPLEVALAGFSSPSVLMIAGLFVVGAALSNTGIADWLGRQLDRIAGASEARVVVVVVLATSLLSALMSSTGTVAILLPVVGTLARRRGIRPGRLFMPLAFAAHLGSNLTLISTPPNILVSDALREVGRTPFGFFSFTLPGLVVLALGVTYLVFFARMGAATPSGSPEASGSTPALSLSLDALAKDYGLVDNVEVVVVAEGSTLAGLTLGQANLRARFGVTVLGIVRQRGELRESLRVMPRAVLNAGDELRLLGEVSAIASLCKELGLVAPTRTESFSLPVDESMAEVVIPRRSRLVGRNLRTAKFRDRYRANVLAVRRAHDEIYLAHTSGGLRDLVLQAGDTLLVKGRSRYLRNLRDERGDLVLVAEPDQPSDRFVDPRRALTATLITTAMLIVMAAAWLPHVLAVLLAALLLVLTGCVRPVEVYRSINWESVVLIACMLPLAAALERTGGTALVVTLLERVLAGASPWVVMALLVCVTSMVGMVLSNTATAVLIAPVAVRLAEALGLAPEPLLMGVAFASSAAFATPIASPVNVLVMAPGGYRFGDFTRVGLPLQLLVLATTVLVVPLVFPF